MGTVSNDQPFRGDDTTSLSRLQAFVDSAFDAYYDWHLQTGLLEISDQLASLLGVAQEALPHTFAEWLDHVHPDDRGETLVKNLRAAMDGSDYVGEYRLRRGDGTYMHVRDRGIILRDGQGHAAHMVGAFSDVSREREAELVLREQAELYTTLFENAVNPAFHIATDGRFLDANQAGLALLETGKAELLERDVGSLWGDEALAAVHASFEAGEGAAISVELELMAGAERKTLAVTLVPCRFHAERTCFALCTDVTEHLTLRRALERSEDLLRGQAASLEDANAALRVILDQRSRDRDELSHAVRDTIESVVLPLLARLAPHLATPEQVCLDAAVRSLLELARPGVTPGALTEGEQHLTLREREIANLIRMGRTSAEIAEALYISPATVAHHRKNLRRKLGLPPRGARLASVLAGHVSLPISDAERP